MPFYIKELDKITKMRLVTFWPQKHFTDLCYFKVSDRYTSLVKYSRNVFLFPIIIYIFFYILSIILRILLFFLKKIAF